MFNRDKIFIALTYTDLYYVLFHAKEGEEQAKAIATLAIMFMVHGYDEDTRHWIGDSDAKECLDFLYKGFIEDENYKEMCKLKKVIASLYESKQQEKQIRVMN